MRNLRRDTLLQQIEHRQGLSDVFQYEPGGPFDQPAPNLVPLGQPEPSFQQPLLGPPTPRDIRVEQGLSDLATQPERRMLADIMARQPEAIPDMVRTAAGRLAFKVGETSIAQTLAVMFENQEGFNRRKDWEDRQNALMAQATEGMSTGQKLAYHAPGLVGTILGDLPFLAAAGPPGLILSTEASRQVGKATKKDVLLTTALVGAGYAVGGGLRQAKKLREAVAPIAPRSSRVQTLAYAGRRGGPGPFGPKRVPTGPLKAAVTHEIRTRKTETALAAQRGQRWRDELKAELNSTVPRRMKRFVDPQMERELSDIGAAVEKVRNLDIKGDTYAKVLRRMTPAMKRVMKKYQVAQEDMRQAVNAYLKPTGSDEYIKFLEDYLPHFYAGGKGRIRKGLNWFMKNSPNAKKRTIPTLEDATKMGLKPLTQDVSFLHRQWADINWRVATSRKLLHSLKDMTLPDGEKVISFGWRKGWKFTDNPALLRMWQKGAYVHPDAWPVVRQVLETPSSNAFGRAVDAFNMYTKKAALSMSGFHHMALTESAGATLGPRRGIAGQFAGSKSTWNKGLKLLQNPENLRDMTMHGLQLSGSPDIAVNRVARDLLSLEAKTRGIPVVGALTKAVRRFNQGWDDALWTRYHSGNKAYAYYHLVEDGIRKAPNMPVDEVKDTVARAVNNAFGGLEWETMWSVSPKMRKWLQRLVFAPDWTLSNVNIALQTLPGVDNKLAQQMGMTYWRNMAVNLVAGHQGLNYALNRKFTWENEPGREMDVDITNLMRALPWHDPEDERRYYFHYGKQVRELFDWVDDPVSTLGKKSSVATKVVFEQFLGETPGTDYPVRWKRHPGEETFWRSIGDRVITVAEKFIPMSAKGNNLAFTFPMGRGTGPWRARQNFAEVFRTVAQPGLPHKWQFWEQANQRVERIRRGALANGLDPDDLMGQALARVRSEYFEAIVDAKTEEKAKAPAEAFLRLSSFDKRPERSAAEKLFSIMDKAQGETEAGQPSISSQLNLLNKVDDMIYDHPGMTKDQKVEAIVKVFRKKQELRDQKNEWILDTSLKIKERSNAVSGNQQTR